VIPDFHFSTKRLAHRRSAGRDTPDAAHNHDARTVTGQLFLNLL
jgi:hypothetical protein